MQRKRPLVTALTVVPCLLQATLSFAQDPQTSFTGLWEGVDIVDGSLRTVAISDVDGDGTWDVHAHDTYWSLCKGPQAVAVLAGTIEASGVLRVKGTVRCPDGKEIAAESTYTPQGDIADGVVMEHLVGTEFNTLMFRKSR